MANQIVKMIICDRCGDSVFLKCIGEGETDGGYTRWNKFEADPEGWAYHSGIGKLCPKCNSLYTNMIKDFMNEESITSTIATSEYAQIDNSGGYQGMEKAIEELYKSLRAVEVYKNDRPISHGELSNLSFYND